METYVIFDNGGRTIDRYTILDKATGEVYAVSGDPSSRTELAKDAGIVQTN
jgi:transposase InsO family protein